jgi:hypothetical protein
MGFHLPENADINAGCVAGHEWKAIPIWLTMRILIVGSYNSQKKAWVSEVPPEY